jgi:hypothetical protein
MFTRGQFNASALLANSLALSGCSQETTADSYEVVAGLTWQLGALNGFKGAALGRELVGYATLAPSSHNTQCWKFALDGTGQAITILPNPTQILAPPG